MGYVARSSVFTVSSASWRPATPGRPTAPAGRPRSRWVRSTPRATVCSSSRRSTEPRGSAPVEARPAQAELRCSALVVTSARLRVRHGDTCAVPVGAQALRADRLAADEAQRAIFATRICSSSPQSMLSITWISTANSLVPPSITEVSVRRASRAAGLYSSTNIAVQPWRASSQKPAAAQRTRPVAADSHSIFSVIRCSRARAAAAWSSRAAIASRTLVCACWSASPPNSPRSRSMSTIA